MSGYEAPQQRFGPRKTLHPARSRNDHVGQAKHAKVAKVRHSLALHLLSESAHIPRVAKLPRRFSVSAAVRLQYPECSTRPALVTMQLQLASFSMLRGDAMEELKAPC